MKKYFVFFISAALCAVCMSCSIGNNETLKLKSGTSSLFVNSSNMQLWFEGEAMVSADSLSGLFINESPIVGSTVVENNEENIILTATNQLGEEVKVIIAFKNGIASLSVEPKQQGINKVSLRLGGMPVAHGLGDIGGVNKAFNLVGDEETTYNLNLDGGIKRWLSTFTIFPQNNFAGVFFAKGKRNVVLSKESYQLNTEVEGPSTFYFFVGDNKAIYANYKQVRQQEGYEDIEPKARLFELGWETWDALGWRATEESVIDFLTKFKKQGYPIKWAVTGSGFWDEGGTTTSFGRYGKKFPNPVKFKEWLNKNDIAWMIGLRTNFVPSGGPYFPKSKQRDRNLKGDEYYGNPLTDEILAKQYLMMDAQGQALTFTSRWFPQVPCYMLDGNVPGAATWYQKQYTKWGVDGIKEDTMMELKEKSSVFNKPIALIAKKGALVMARCGEISSPGTLLRINDTGVATMKSRTPINYLQYAACGFPNVYSDVAGIKNMHNMNAIVDNLRHTWMLSVTAGMAVGKLPQKWPEEDIKTFKKAVDYHYQLVPYLYSAGMESYKSGYPYTLTPMSIAYSNDDNAVHFQYYQWMIGESVLATPVLKNPGAKGKDVYLPEGVWYDWDSGEKFIGPLTLKNHPIPVAKTPCFVGGKGVVVLRKDNSEKLIARVYNVGLKSVADFYTLKEGNKYSIEIATTNLEKASVIDVSSGEKVAFETQKGYIEFPIVEGQNYKIN